MASYRKAIQWIADNDESACMDPGEMVTAITVALVADIFGKEDGEVARAVINHRRRDRRG